jgi:hypothetical protein
MIRVHALLRQTPPVRVCEAPGRAAHQAREDAPGIGGKGPENVAPPCSGPGSDAGRENVALGLAVWVEDRGEGTAGRGSGRSGNRGSHPTTV